MMQISSLKLFIEVMTLGSYAAVARQQNVDPSSVSRAISSLEKELGFKLFQRNTKKLSPTEAGALYFEKIKDLTIDLEQAGQEALDLTSEPKGILRITACTSLGQRVIAPLLPKFMSAYPALSLDLQLTDSPINLVAEQIDLAIRFGPKPEDDVVSSKLADRRFRVCASPAYIQRMGGMLSPEELSEREVLRFPFSGYDKNWQYRDKEGRIGKVEVKGRLLISHGLTMTQCAVAGLGPALLPDWLCINEISDGSLVNLFPEHEFAAANFDTAAWMVHPSKSYVPQKVYAFMDFLRENTQLDQA